jgi:hypothetical protein
LQAGIILFLPGRGGKSLAAVNYTGDICKYASGDKNMFLKVFFKGKFDSKKFAGTCPIKPVIKKDS